MEQLLDQASCALRDMRADELEALGAEVERAAAICRVLGSTDIVLLERSLERFTGLLDSTRNSLYLLEHFSGQEQYERANLWAR
ncbi:MAG: hypothetical protein JSS87_13425 [Acidobacteria bacterium]|nr:hypothetical protein [Acidobacteriota bacterium]